VVTNQVGQQAAVKQALDNMALDYVGGDTNYQVESTVVDGQWVQLTSMRDGLQRPPIPRIHAERVLQKMLSDGSPAFWIEGMGYSPPEPLIGSIKCYFHPDFDEADGPSGLGREFIVQAGLGDFRCNSGDRSKQNRGDFKTVMMRDAHMHSRHRRQLEAVEKAQGNEKEQQEHTERQLDREYQRQQTEAMLELLGRQIKNEGGTVATAAVETSTTAVTFDASAVTVNSDATVSTRVTCDICGQECQDARGLAAHQRQTKDESHTAARMEQG